MYHAKNAIVKLRALLMQYEENTLAGLPVSSEHVSLWTGAEGSAEGV